MFKKILIALGFVLALALVVNDALAASVLTVPAGGTGTSTLTTGSVVITNPTKATGSLQTVLGVNGLFLRASSTAPSKFDFSSASGAATPPGGNPTSVQYNNAGAFGGSDNFQWINAVNLLLLNGASSIIQTSPTSSAVFGNTVLGGGVTAFSTSTNISAQNFLCGVGLAYANSTSSLTTNLKFPDLTQIANQAAVGCGGGAQTIWASQFSPQYVFNASTSSVLSISASGTGQSIFYAPGTGSLTQPGQGYLAAGQFTASSTIAGATTTGMSLNFYFGGYQPRATNPTMQGQFIMASTTASGALAEWTVGNLLATSPVTVATGTAGTITVACSTCLTGNQTITLSGVVTGSGATSIATVFGVGDFATGTTGTIFNIATTTTSLTINMPTANIVNTGQLSSADWLTFNNKLSGSGVVNQVTYFTVASTTAGSANFLWDNTARSLIINSTTPAQANLQVNASTTQTTDIFRVASTSGSSYFSVNGNGSTTISSLNGVGCVGTTATGALFVTGCGSGGGISGGTTGFAAIFTSPTAVAKGILMDNSTVAGVNATNSTVSFLVQGTTTLNPFQVNTSTGISVLRVNPNLTVGINTTTNASILFVQSTSTYTNLPLLTLASSSGASFFNVDQNGLVTIQPTSTSTAAFLINNPAGQGVITVDTNLVGAGNELTIQNSASQNLFTVDWNGAVVASSTVTTSHIIGGTAAPTVATSTGIGATCTTTSCTATITGTDLAGFLVAQTGTSPAANTTIITVTFKSAYGAPPYCVVANASSTTSSIWSTTTTTTLLLKSNTALPASSNIGWYYLCAQ